MYEFLKDYFTKWELTYLLVAREKHVDGGNHYHAFIITNGKFDIKNPRALDFKEKHPNIQKPINRDNVVGYVKKDQDFRESCDYITK